MDINSLSTLTAESLLQMGSSCAVGYAFAMRTTVVGLKERLKEKDEVIAYLKLEKEKLAEFQKVFWDRHERRESPRGHNNPKDDS